MNMLEGCRGRTLAAGLAWLNEPEEWAAGPDGLRAALRVSSDFFRPHGGEARDDAHLLHARLSGDFALEASIEATLANTFDAGGLMVRGGEDQWVKLCVERGVRGETKVVSVVTRRWSDDADHFLLPAPRAWLRITRKGAQFGLHWSEDGRLWRFVRAFALELPEEVAAGALAQAPRAPGGSVRFAALSWSRTTAADFRSGE